jgi:hypothetical protein
VLFGPYIVDESGRKEYVNHWEGDAAHKKLARYGVLADGPGEDAVFFALTRAGKIAKMLVQPKDTGILAGTTRQYLIDYLAPGMNISVEESPVTIDDIRRGRVQAMAMCGNAANVAPIRELSVYSPNLKKLEKFILKIGDHVLKLVHRFEDELNSRVRPSGEHLLTQIRLDLDNRNRLLDIYSGWY